MSTKPDTTDKEVVESLQQDILQRLKNLAARVPLARADLNLLRSSVGEINAIRSKCRSFVEGQHPQLNDLANAAVTEVQKQAEQINSLNTDLSRAVELSELFVAARAESWLRCESLIVLPACDWTEVAGNQSMDFESKLKHLREWHKLKTPRWAPN